MYEFYVCLYFLKIRKSAFWKTNFVSGKSLVQHDFKNTFQRDVCCFIVFNDTQNQLDFQHLESIS